MLTYSQTSFYGEKAALAMRRREGFERLFGKDLCVGLSDVVIEKVTQANSKWQVGHGGVWVRACMRVRVCLCVCVCVA